MRKRLVVMLLSIVVLMMACSAAYGDSLLQTYIARIKDPDHPIRYTVSTLRYGTMTIPEGYVPGFVEILAQSRIVPVDRGNEHSGEYVALAFPDENIRFDFECAEAGNNYVRQINPDGSEEIFRIYLPDDVLVTVSALMKIESDMLAEAIGLSVQDSPDNLEQSWLEESLNGAYWVSGRAMLVITMESQDRYSVIIDWAKNARDVVEWSYSCTFDEQTAILQADHVAREQVTYYPNGSEKHSGLSEGDSDTVFFLNEEGRLTIWKAGYDELEGLTFEEISSVIIQ